MANFPTPRNISSLHDVLKFWYPEPNQNTSPNREYLNDMNYFYQHLSGWMNGGVEMDEKCKHFQELIREVARANSLLKEPEKRVNKTEKLLELIARLILFDQISRNAFRYSKEAFAYEELVADLLKEIFNAQNKVDEQLSKFMQENSDVLRFADYFFIVVACQHQEDPFFYGIDRKIVKLMDIRWPESRIFLQSVLSQCDSHLAVLKRFGRYPHRNDTKGPRHTIEEVVWLNDYYNLPGWARSQYIRK